LNPEKWGKKTQKWGREGIFGGGWDGGTPHLLQRGSSTPNEQQRRLGHLGVLDGRHRVGDAGTGGDDGDADATCGEMGGEGVEGGSPSWDTPKTLQPLGQEKVLAMGSTSSPVLTRATKLSPEGNKQG